MSWKAEIIFVNNGYFIVYMPFNARINTHLKLVKFRKWLPQTKCWLFNRAHFDQVVEILKEHSLDIQTYAGYMYIDEMIGISLSTTQSQLVNYIKRFFDGVWNEEKKLYLMDKDYYSDLLRLFLKFEFDQPKLMPQLDIDLQNNTNNQEKKVIDNKWSFDEMKDEIQSTQVLKKIKPTPRLPFTDIVNENGNEVWYSAKKVFDGNDNENSKKFTHSSKSAFAEFNPFQSKE
jgi:hypothetical protein